MRNKSESSYIRTVSILLSIFKEFITSCLVASPGVVYRNRISENTGSMTVERLR